MRLFGRRSHASARTDAVIRQVAAWCLHYPDDALRRNLGLLGDCVGELGDHEAAGHLRAVVEHLRSTPAREAEQHYVEVFDTKPRRGLYLTWYLHGDTRLRGGALAELVALYRSHDFQVEGGELPDYLPVLLEFTATGGPAAVREGERLLARFRPALELLARKLDEVTTPYVGAVRGVLSTMPREHRQEIPVGPPPREHVGLDPYPSAARGGNR
ncbi:nitrate reductase molybdenum cofactor assembly chaperone [Saccharopolyspora erythraea]|uniref:nitrate reductase molybdenum cofactor assembly chaperone n=1 Tax=Saccharopolyspora erythraea TaxID=1836 RepID=UPI001BAD8168|nr:nitrate reductase molybdenum cofactor assembly chaperone [Saccharopolyspora erythraea]QUH06082.1 nitrate reductase molybdenum cofactor assembly chaperone [Saccharopolyspora erythraea]